MASRLAALVAFNAGVAASDDCIQAGDASWLDCIKEAGTYHLPEGKFILDRHFQMPDGVTILGAGPDKTTIEAARAVENGCGKNISQSEYPGDPSTRIGFVLGNDCRIGGFKFLSKDTHRWQNYYGAALCGGAVFETPGCADAYCAGGNIGEGHGDGGVKNIVIEDVVISGATPDTAPQLAVFVTQTKDLDAPTVGVHIKGIRMDHSFCDGINLHGAVRDAVVEHCELFFQGDDNLAVWSAGDRADNITFRHNIVSQARTENHPSPRWGNCVALYGGSGISVLNTTCYHSSNAGVRMSDEFRGAWGQNSQITVEDMVTDEAIPGCQGGPNGKVSCSSGQLPSSLPGWVQHANTNCYEGNGAAAVPPDAYAPQEGITAVACMAACAASTIPCTAVVTSDNGECFLRTAVDLNSCQQDGYHDVWLAPTTGVPPPAPPPPSPVVPPAPPPPSRFIVRSTLYPVCLSVGGSVMGASVISHTCYPSAPSWLLRNETGGLVYSEPTPHGELCAVSRDRSSIQLQVCGVDTTATWAFTDDGFLQFTDDQGSLCVDLVLSSHGRFVHVKKAVVLQPCDAKSSKWTAVESSDASAAMLGFVV